MGRPGRYGRAILGLLVFGTVSVIAIVVRYLLNVPQPFESRLSGVKHVYRWTDGDIFYKVMGVVGAPAVLVVHAPGIGASSDEVRHLVAGLASRYRVYTFDLLGFGLSDHPDVAYTAENYRRLCEHFLRDVVGEPAILVARGLACQYVLSLAAQVPELCTRIVCISPEIGSEKKYPLWLSDALLYSPLGLFTYALLTAPPLVRLAFASQYHMHLHDVADEDVQLILASAHQVGAEHAALAYLVGKMDVDVTPLLPLLQQPMLILQSAISSSHPQWIHLLSEGKMVTRQIIEHCDGSFDAIISEKITRAIVLWLAEKSSSVDSPSFATARSYPASEIPHKSLLNGAFLRSISEREAKSATDHPASLYRSIVEQAPEVEDKNSIEQIPGIEDKDAVEQAPEVEDQGVIEQVPEIEDQSIDIMPAVEIESGVLAAQPESTENAAVEKPEVDSTLFEAYCARCRQKRQIVHAKKVVTKNGRNALEGICAVCGAKLFRFIAKNA